MDAGSPHDAASSESHEPSIASGADRDPIPLTGEPDNSTVRRLDPRVRLLWWTSGGLVLLWVGLIVGVIDVLAPLPTRAGLLTGGVVLLVAVVVGALPILRYRRWRYALRDHDLWIRQGVLWVTVSVIPFARLQFVDTRQGPLDRLYGLSQLVVHTAALGTSGQLPGLDADEAERLRERLTRLQPDESVSV